MARLPSAPDLGSAPNAQVQQTDLSAFGRGAQALASGVEKLGEGISKLGAGTAAYALDQNHWEFAKAVSVFITNKVDLDARTAQETNPGPDDSGQDLRARYDNDIIQIQNSAADQIRDPRLREHFLMETRPHVQRGVEIANAHAAKLENDRDVAWTMSAGDKLIDQAVTSPDEPTRRQIIDSHNQLIDALVQKGAIGAVRAVELKKQWAVQYAEADVRARIDRGDFAVVDELRNARGTAPEPRPRTFDGAFPRAGDRAAAADAIERTANNLGISPRDLAAAISYETGGKFDPNLVGGKGNNYLGLIQFGPEERAKYGVKPGMSFPEQMQAVESFLRDRGLKPGMGLPEIYSIVNAGSLDRNGRPRWAASDGNGTVRSHVAAIEREHVANADRFLGAPAGGQQFAQADTGTATDTGGQGGARTIYSLLPPDKREKLIEFGLNQQHTRIAQGLAEFKASVDDNLAEADRTGDVKQEIPRETFTAKLGPELGAQQYQRYRDDLQFLRDKGKVAQMNPEEQARLLENYNPKEGDGYQLAARRQDTLNKAINQVAKEKAEDPAGFVVRRLPASGPAFQRLESTLSNPAATDDDRAAAAKNYATIAKMEQSHVGVPTDAQRVVPQAYIDRLNNTIATAADSEDPQKRIALVGMISREAKMWGENWPAVMRALAPAAQPVVRAIAAGADPAAMTRLLSLGKDENPAKLLKEQNETKAADLDKAINTEMAPFLQTLIGRQRDRDYTGYFNLARQLGALYVRDGKSASEAASAAFADLIGKRYEFRDTWRIPRSIGVAPDDVQAGTVAVRRELKAATGPDRQANAFGIKPAINDMGLSDNDADSFSKIARDGRFVTSPDNNGLNLVYGDRFVRTEDGKPFFLSWPQLAKLGTTPEARARAAEEARLNSAQTP
jgi:hypothetical protein